MENIQQIQSYARMGYQDRVPDRRNRSEKRKKRPVKKATQRFLTLSRMADDTHRTLVTKGSPIRLCVYQEGDDLLLDVLSRDPEKNKQHLFSRSITGEKLSGLIRQMHRQRGLVLDYSL